jgi:hypothetical protein
MAKQDKEDFTPVGAQFIAPSEEIMQLEVDWSQDPQREPGPINLHRYVGSLPTRA